MNDATDIGTRVVDGTVDHRARLIQAIFEVAKIWARQNIAVMVNLKQTRGRNFFVHHAVGID